MRRATMDRQAATDCGGWRAAYRLWQIKQQGSSYALTEAGCDGVGQRHALHAKQSTHVLRSPCCGRSCMSKAAPHGIRVAEARLCVGVPSYVPGVLTTSFMFKRLTPLNGFFVLSRVPVPVAFA